MTIADQVTAVEASNVALVAGQGVLIGKVDNLMLVASQTKDALVAALANATGTDPALEARLQAVIDSQTAAMTKITDEGTKVDAAGAADAP